MVCQDVTGDRKQPFVSELSVPRRKGRGLDLSKHVLHGPPFKMFLGHKLLGKRKMLMFPGETEIAQLQDVGDGEALKRKGLRIVHPCLPSAHHIRTSSSLYSILQPN